MITHIRSLIWVGIHWKIIWKREQTLQSSSSQFRLWVFHKNYSCANNLINVSEFKKFLLSNYSCSCMRYHFDEIPLFIPCFVVRFCHSMHFPFSSSSFDYLNCLINYTIVFWRFSFSCKTFFIENEMEKIRVNFTLNWIDTMINGKF